MDTQGYLLYWSYGYNSQSQYPDDPFEFARKHFLRRPVARRRDAHQSLVPTAGALAQRKIGSSRSWSYSSIQTRIREAVFQNLGA
jgi:hypothetical protein